MGIETISNMSVCVLFVIVFVTAKPMYNNIIEPTFNKVGSISYNCQQSVKESKTFFQASKGCLYIKGE